MFSLLLHDVLEADDKKAQSYGFGGTVPLHCELSATFIAKAIRKVQSQGYQSICPSQEATADFNEFVEQYFEDKVLGDSCNSWLKAAQGKSRTLFGWPGTGHESLSDRSFAGAFSSNIN